MQDAQVTKSLHNGLFYNLKGKSLTQKPRVKGLKHFVYNKGNFICVLF